MNQNNDQFDRAKQMNIDAVVQKELRDDSKKSFGMGFFSGVVVVVFLVGLILCASVVLDNVKAKNDMSLLHESIDDLTKKNKSDSILSDKKAVEKIILLQDIIDKYYIDEVDDETVKNGIYSGMLESLDDPYSVYYDADALKKLNEDTQGVYYGIGAYLQKDTETLYPRITGIIKNTPAEEAGLMADDFITKVDGVDVFDMELSDAVSLVKGAEGTYVTLTIIRKSTNETFDVDVQRRKVETPTVNHEMYGDIGYIQITEFDAITTEQFLEALASCKGSGMKGMILDLRGNPGGSLTTVVDIANYFLPKGLVVYTEDKNGKRDEYTSNGKNEIDIPLVVLVNGGSASASEILAGAIKDYKKGTLLGTTTFGKGIVQRVLGLPDGTAVKLTVSHYYTPLGNDIHKIGVQPDEELEFDADRFMNEDGYDNQLERAKELLKEQIK